MVGMVLYASAHHTPNTAYWPCCGCAIVSVWNQANHLRGFEEWYYMRNLVKSMFV